MQTPEIINFTVMATVGVAFLQQQMSDDTANRVMQFERIVGACTAVLQFIGRPRYLDSLFQLWSGLTHSLILMEALLFPEQPIQTSSQLALPRENMPLSHILDDGFQPMAYRIPLAIQALADYTDWFHDKYDDELHREMASLLDDSMLIFQSIHQILQLRPARQLQHSQRLTPVDMTPQPCYLLRCLLKSHLTTLGLLDRVQGP